MIPEGVKQLDVDKLLKEVHVSVYLQKYALCVKSNDKCVVKSFDFLLYKAVVNTYKGLKDDKFRQIRNKLRHFYLIPSLKN